jgi:hypothetical protein
MQDVDWDQIRATLPSARKRALLSTRGRHVQSRDQAILYRRYSELLSSSLTVGNRGELDQVRKQYQAEGKRLLEAEKKAAIERSSAELVALRSTINTRSGTTQTSVSTQETGGKSPFDLKIPNFNFIILDQPGLIRKYSEVL